MNPEWEDLQDSKARRYQLSDEGFSTFSCQKIFTEKNKKRCLQLVFFLTQLYFVANGFPKINLEPLTDEPEDR